MTKLKLNLYDLLVQALGGETTQIPATVDVSELLDSNDNYECEHDLEELLADNRLIAHLWSTEDVKRIRSELSDDQAWAVLQRVEQDLNRSRGITRETLEQAAYDLFGSGSTRRVERCETALHAYNDDLPESNLIDLMADAMHRCQAQGQDFDAALTKARDHFHTETTNE